MPALPLALSDLTPEWLTTTLRGAGHLDDASVVSARVEPIGQGVGVLCQLARIALAYDRAAPGAPARLVAKLPTTDPQTRGMVSLFRFYEREVRFYQALAPSVALATPRCWAGALDAESGDFALLLEDLGGQRVVDQLAGGTATDAALVVDEISALHAAWWGDPRLAELAWLPPVNSDVNRMGLGLYPTAWASFLDRFGDAVSPAARAYGDRLGDRVLPLLEEIADGPPTVCHGDLRLDNVFFRAPAPSEGAAPAGAPRVGGARPVTFIDWQIAGRAVGTYDVAYFVSQSLAADVRRGCERDLLARYHAALVAGGVRGYDFAQCEADYRRAVVFCFVYPVMAGGLGDLSNERGRALATAMAERSATALSDWNAGELLR
jgi:hypothetical protein